MHDDDRPADPLAFDAQHEDPLDLAALRADDEFIEALIGGRVSRPATTAVGAAHTVDDELTAMLAAWVSEVRPETVAADPAVITTVTERVTSAIVSPATPLRGPRHRRLPAAHYGRVAAAAAIVVLAASGLAVGAWESQPGQVLFPVAKVVFAERAASMQAAADVSSSLAVARSAMDRGDTQAAATALAAAQARLDGVRSSEGHDELAQAQDDLISQLPPGVFAAAVAASDPGTGTPPPTGSDQGALAAGEGPTPIAAAPITPEPTPSSASTTAPVVAAPTTDTPTTDTPTSEAPSTEAPVTDTPIAETPVEPTTAPEPTLGSDAPASPAPIDESTPDPTTAPETTTPETTPAEPSETETIAPETVVPTDETVTETPPPAAPPSYEPIDDNPEPIGPPTTEAPVTEATVTEATVTEAPVSIEPTVEPTETTSPTTTTEPPSGGEDGPRPVGPVRAVVGLVGGTLHTLLG